MQVSNIKDMEVWLNNLWNSGFVFLRYKSYPTGFLHMNWKEELRKHGRMYEKDNKHFTFHHIRLLFRDLENNKMNHPLVGTPGYRHMIQIDPGGSRLMVAKKLRMKTVPLDFICKKDEILIARSTKYKKIRNTQEFLKPFDNIDEEVNIEFTDGEKFCYEINFKKAFHWCIDDVEQWIDSKQHIQCPNPIDYYFI